MKPLSVDDIRYIALVLARDMMTWDEPIPDFENRISGRLESCLAAPFQTFDGQELFLSFSEKAAALFYYMIKSHPLENGNKRLAVTTLLIFLYFDGKWLDLNPQQLYKMALNIADSEATASDKIIEKLTLFLNETIVPR